MAVIRPSICLLPFWEQAKSVGQFGQLKKPDELRAGIRKSLPVSLPGAGVQTSVPFLCKTLEVNSISDYLTVTTPLPQYLPYARFLLDTDLSHTAKLLYTLLLDRATLSQKNNWMDERGFVYVIFPLSALSEALRCSTMSIKRALRSLEDADLIERRRGRITVPNSIFVKVPTEQK